MKKKDNINLVIYLFVSFVFGGLLMYLIAINTDVLSMNLSNNNIINNSSSTCRACSSTVIVNDGSLSASVEKAYDGVMLIRNYKVCKL